MLSFAKYLILLGGFLLSTQVLGQSFSPQFYPEEGYLQAWNFSFRNEKHQIFTTFLVSNFGPGSYNNGISILMRTKGKPIYYSTKEFAEEDYESRTSPFFFRSYNSTIEFKEGKYFIHLYFDDREIHLTYTPRKGFIPISRGKYPLKNTGTFVQADIPFSHSYVTGTIKINNEEEIIIGKGGMEHLLANEPVYNFSKKWEIVRGETENGIRIFTGGFLGNQNFPGGYFRRIALLSKQGDLVLDGTVENVEVLEWEKEPISGYTIPKKEVLYFNGKSCTLQVTRNKNIASISALENISAFLRFFIQLFFAKPYQIHSQVDLQLNCKGEVWKAQGIHSNYLINE